MFEYRSLLDRGSRDPASWDDLFRGFDQLFRGLDRDAPITSYGHAPSQVVEEDGRYVLTVEAPGLTEKDVKVDVHDGVLTVTAERTPEAPQGFAVRRRERPVVRFSKSYVIGDKLDPERTTAEIKDGVLTVGIAKAAAREKKTIPIKVS